MNEKMKEMDKLDFRYKYPPSRWVDNEVKVYGYAKLWGMIVCYTRLGTIKKEVNGKYIFKLNGSVVSLDRYAMEQIVNRIEELE